MIFPGMDPYLEEAAFWPGIHNSAAVYLAEHLQPRLRPRYVAALAERVFVEQTGLPVVRKGAHQQARRRTAEALAGTLESDVPEVIRIPKLELHEWYVRILDRQSGLKIVTVIELVSLTSKYEGPGRESYLANQREVFESDAHLVEIDLLRTGLHVVKIPARDVCVLGPYDYVVCVNRAVGLREDYEIYRRTLPKFGIPLAEGDPDVALDLQSIVARAYDAGVYRDRLSYDRPCVPPLSVDDQLWANELIRNAGLGTP